MKSLRPLSRLLGDRRRLALAALLLAGCQQEMANQPSLKPMLACDFGPHGSSLRQPVDGTVARGRLRLDSEFYRGRPAGESQPNPDSIDQAKAEEPAAQPLVSAEARMNRNVTSEFPLPVDARLIRHGRDRYMIYCVVCHDSLGTGQGKIVQRGYTRPPSYHIERLRNAPIGHLFLVVSDGYGSMPSYRGQISTRDRWAILAYVRALQLSQHFPEAELTDEMRRDRAAAGKPVSDQRPPP